MNVEDVIESLAVDACDEREVCFQDYIAALLKAKSRVVINGIEVDVHADELAIEVKVNPRIYDGVGQALAYRRLLNIREVWLIHIFKHRVDLSQWCSSLGKLLEGLQVNYAVIAKDGICLNGIIKLNL